MRKLGILIIIIILAIMALFLLKKDTEAPTLSNRNETQKTEVVTPSAPGTKTDTQTGVQAQTTEYVCEGGRPVLLTLSGPEYQNAKVSFPESDISPLSLTHVVSASGSRYANGDESIVFWSQGNEAFIEQNGKTTYENCIQK